MTGWTWADTDDVNALFNFYIGSSQLGPGPDAYVSTTNFFAQTFFADGWNETQNLNPSGLSSSETVGLMSNSSTTVALMGFVADLNANGANTGLDIDNSDVITYGGWFYRPLDTDGDMICDEDRSVTGVCIAGPAGGDNCPTIPNNDQADDDSDGCGNACQFSGCFGIQCAN